MVGSRPVTAKKVVDSIDNSRCHNRQNGPSIQHNNHHMHSDNCSNPLIVNMDQIVL